MTDCEFINEKRQMQVNASSANNNAHTGNKYLRLIRGSRLEAQPDQAGVLWVDVYDVLDAFDVTCPARQHAIKKLLAAGLSGKGSAVKDMSEARDAISRAIELEAQRSKNESKEP